jgi:hypothetical protein
MKMDRRTTPTPNQSGAHLQTSSGKGKTHYYYISSPLALLLSFIVVKENTSTMITPATANSLKQSY